MNKFNPPPFITSLFIGGLVFMLFIGAYYSESSPYEEIELDNPKYDYISNSVRIPEFQDSVIGIWSDYGWPFKRYSTIYTKNDTIFYERYSMNEEYEDSQNGSDFFQFERQYVLELVSIKNYNIYQVKHYKIDSLNQAFLSTSYDGFFLIDGNGNLYRGGYSFFSENDSVVVSLYPPIESPDELFRYHVESPRKEKYYQKLCEENDTNTIGWFFPEYSSYLSTRLYLIDGKQPAIMIEGEDDAYETYRVSMLPHPDGYKIKAITGTLANDGIYQVLSEDSTKLYYYTEDDKLYRTEYAWGIEYSQWHIGVCCEHDFYSLSEEN